MNQGPKSEAGYALLLIYAMAAMVAIMLYTQLPRVAFEAQRDKEQLLIDRGEQYSRAVQLFVRKYKRFPQDVEALENTQQIRFLRRKYKDPMTGKDEWRKIHVGPGGAFTDSLVYGTKKKTDQNAPQTFIAEMQQIGGNTGTPETGVNQAARRRASDQPGAPGSLNNDPNNPGQYNPAQPFPGNGNAPNSGAVMVLPDGRVVPANYTGQPSPTPPPGQPGLNGQNLPPGVAPPSGIGFQQPSSPNGLPQGFQNQPNIPGAPPNAAANIINQILTTPRPGGLNGDFGGGTTGTPIGQGLGGQTIGGGFAGVASKAEQEGIKSYKDRTVYNEWEFVYDMSKDASINGGGRGGVPVTGAPGSPVPGNPANPLTGSGFNQPPPVLPPK